MNNLAQAWQEMIVCQGPDCGFDDLIQLVVAVIDNLVILSTILATIGFIYVGFRLMTSGGDPGAKSDAKHIFKNILIGYVVILVAWLLVYTIMNVLVNPEFNFILGNSR
ncbi:MAG: hypothetical protein ACYCY6_00270 [Minisyncoccota bacterium]